jgi:hypothetical protein
MAGNRRHLPKQDTPSATPTENPVATAETCFRLSVLRLKKLFPKGYRPTSQERLALAKYLEKAARDLFVAKARATLPGQPLSRCPTVLKELLEQVVRRAEKAWMESAHKYRLVWLIRESAKQRSWLKTASKGQRELPPTDAIDIAERVRKFLTPVAEELEHQACENALLRNQAANSERAAQTAGEHRGRRFKDSVGPTPQVAVESENLNTHGSRRGGVATAKRRRGAFDDFGKNEPLMLPNIMEEDAPGRDDAMKTVTECKGDPSLLDGKRLVSSKTAQEYLGIGERQLQKLIKAGKLKAEGAGQTRKITSESLKGRLPVENSN